MSFLVAEILGLLALAALFGGALVYWWLRRSLVDVSSEYALYQTALTELDDLRKSRSAADARIAALEAEGAQLEGRLNDELAWRPTLEGRLDELKPASLEPVMGQLSGLADAVAGIRPADLSGLEGRLGALDSAVAEIPPADLSGLEYKLNVLQGGVAKLENTDVSGLVSGVAAVSATVAALKPTDLTPVQAKLEDVEGRVAALRNTDLSGVDAKLKELDTRVARLRNADLSGIEGRLGSVEKALSGINPTDLTPVEKRFADLDQRVRALRNADLSGIEGRVKSLTDSVNRLDSRIQPHPAPDFSGIYKRLDAVEKTLRAQPKTAPAPKPTLALQPKPEPKAPRKPGGNLLQSASFGKPDDLKRISGIGPKLEKMLHGIGVYYFWQVADWDGSDVRHVDDLLDAFKGRISRDEWVRQAGGLAREPGSAKGEGGR